jgi:peroxiredoxin
MVLTETPAGELGTTAPAFSLHDPNGKLWSLADCRGEKGTLVMFICNHCPYVKAIQERLVRDTNELLTHGVNSVAIMSNDPTDYPEDSVDNMRLVAATWKYPFPYLFDETQDIARNYGAVCTPDFFGYDADLKLKYRGRLDSGGREAKPNLRRELVEAMIDIAEGRPAPSQQLPSVGCSIKWRRGH